MSKFCSNCGNEVNDDTKFCSTCGNTVNSTPQVVQNNNQNTNGYTCPKCHSNNISFQIVNHVNLVRKHHGLLWWIIIGWWWIPLKWFIFFVPALIFKVFGVGKRYKTKNVEHKAAVCQNCGYSWNI